MHVIIIIRTFSSIARNINVALNMRNNALATNVERFIRLYSMLTKPFYVLFRDSSWSTKCFLVCPLFAALSRRELAKEFEDRFFSHTSPRQGKRAVFMNTALFILAS